MGFIFRVQTYHRLHFSSSHIEPATPHCATRTTRQSHDTPHAARRPSLLPVVPALHQHLHPCRLQRNRAHHQARLLVRTKPCVVVCLPRGCRDPPKSWYLDSVVARHSATALPPRLRLCLNEQARHAPAVLRLSTATTVVVLVQYRQQ